MRPRGLLYVEDGRRRWRKKKIVMMVGWCTMARRRCRWCAHVPAIVTTVRRWDLGHTAVKEEEIGRLRLRLGF